jgi:uncharacterized membrane protein
LPQVAPPPARVHAHRVIFIDLARALAVLFMLYGHVLDALLAPEYRVGTWYDVWQFQRGLTSSLFLTLSGFAFSIATARHWASHLSPSGKLLKRIRRFALFILLGYALHVPVARLVDLRYAAPEQWRSFLAVDVLQLIGVTFIGVQLLVLVCRTRRAFMITALVLTAAIVLLTPFLWSVPWSERLPLGLASYFSPANGSQFPLFPWAGFVLLGAGLGQVYARWGAARLGRFANVVLLAPGAVMIGVALAARVLPFPLFGGGPAAFVPGEVLLRAGVCLVLLAAMAHVSGRIDRLPHIFGAVAQETLLIYFVHLCIVYGSVWNPGLAASYAMALTPMQTLGAVLAVISSMVLLAWYWNWAKHVSPRRTRWVSVSVGALLLLRLM